MKCMSVWVAGVAVLALAGCGDADPAAGPATSATSSVAGDATEGAGAPPASAAVPSPSATVVLADGRSPVYLTGLDAAGKTVTFDLIEFLTGEKAKAEWKKLHPEYPDGPDNDYMIVNNNKKLRTLPVAAGATCVVLASLGGTETTTVGFAALPAFLEEQNKDLTLTEPQIAVLPFWLTVKGGKVVKFEEQFLP